MKKAFALLGIMCLLPVGLLAKPTVSEPISLEKLGYPDLQVRHIYGNSMEDLEEIKEYLPYLDKIKDADRNFNKKEISFTPSDPRPEKYNLIKSSNVDFFYEGNLDYVGTSSGLKGSIIDFESYNNHAGYIIKDIYIPQQYVENLFVDLGQRGGNDEGVGYMMAILNDTEVIYYGDSNRLHEHWSSTTYFQPLRAIFKVNKPMKISIVCYKTNSDDFYERISIREIPKDISYSALIKSVDDKELGDNTLPSILYDLQVNHSYFDKTNPFYYDFKLNCLVNNNLFYNYQLKDLDTYYIEGGKVYTKVQASNFKEDKLKGARGELLGYGTPPLSWILKLPLKEGVPILQQLIDLAYSMGYSEQERVIILNDANRKWDYNEKNVHLINELDSVLKRYNIHLFLIGEYDENLFGPLLENK